ncbi:TetR/AcrR family transcriptional regulator [Pseudonocardia spinosispora]|uniref:TetR/AcrR family transcriptional regulator n=1 Tax=Pseudonocardia spinosispora TaxID=103441 RepID=UPI0003FE6DF9|nr:TetR/AcrR family transcriptional regulator [Pseudonocardia spinosispora]
MDVKKPTRRRVGRTERERQILDAATAVFTERGYQAASMDAVAERVGVTKPVLYDHFGSKEGLLLASVARTRQELLTETTKAVAGASEPEDMVRRGFRAFFDFLDARAYAWTLLYEGAMNPVGTAGEAVDSIRNQHIDLIVGMIRLQAPDADPRRLESYAHIIVGASERLALWRNRRGDVSAADATEYLMDMIWTGMGGKWRERGAQQ